MNPQPDTTTLEGKIAVMEASKTRRIEFRCRDRHTFNDAWGAVDPGCAITEWNWADFDYRIHPEDLNPTYAHELCLKPRYRPWKPEEVPVGKLILYKHGDKRCKHLILSTEINGIFYASGSKGQWATYESLLEHYTLEDGSPCGVSEPS